MGLEFISLDLKYWILLFSIRCGSLLNSNRYIVQNYYKNVNKHVPAHRSSEKHNKILAKCSMKNNFLKSFISKAQRHDNIKNYCSERTWPADIQIKIIGEKFLHYGENWCHDNRNSFDDTAQLTFVGRMCHTNLLFALLQNNSVSKARNGGRHWNLQFYKRPGNTQANDLQHAYF